MKLQVVSGPLKDTVFSINKPVVTIGRKKEQDIHLPDDIQLSRCHCELIENEKGYTLVDLNSGNGTWYEGEKITSIELVPGSIFRVGSTEFQIIESRKTRRHTIRTAITNDINISGIVSLTVDHEDDHEDVEILKTRLLVLQEVSRKLVGKLRMKEFLEAVVESIVKAVKAERAFVFLLDEDGNISEPVVVKNYSSDILISETILKKCIDEKVALSIQDTLNHEELKNRDSIKENAIRSAMCIPLIYKNNVMAIIYLDARRENTFTEGDLKLVTSITSQASVAVENIKLYEELEEKHKALQSAQEHLVKNEKLSIIGTLATSISHDMRNILTPILGVSSLILKDQNLNPQLRNAFERQIQRLQSLTQQILSLVRTQSISLVPGQLNEKLQESLDLLKTEARYHNVQVETKFDTTISSIYADFNRLDQVFINIALNAFQAMDKQKNAKLVVKTENKEENVVITFTDNGPGIDKGYLNLIFEPFFTTKNTGTGMGLFSCKKIIEEDHSGDLRIESEVGKGTSFIITLNKKLRPNYYPTK